MSRTFIEVPIFTKKWFALGLTDDDLQELQNIIMQDPKNAGTVLQGTGGIRKIRISANGHGKRGGGRVIFVDIAIKETVYFLNVYAKNEKDDLSDAERKALKMAVLLLKEES